MEIMQINNIRIEKVNITRHPTDIFQKEVFMNKFRIKSTISVT
jgi:hypothetical protein